jgi:hypothetical protein
MSKHAADRARPVINAKEPPMTHPIARPLGYATVAVGAAAARYVGLVTGACPVDLGVGRRARPLGPQLVKIAAPRWLVFDLIAEPYLDRASRAMADKLRGALGSHGAGWSPDAGRTPWRRRLPPSREKQNGAPPPRPAIGVPAIDRGQQASG